MKGRTVKGRPLKALTPAQRAYARALFCVGVLLITGSLIRLPFMFMTPGPTFDLLGEDSGKEIIEISGTPTFPTKGQLDMTTVSEYGGSSGGVAVVEGIYGWALPSAKVIPREVYYPNAQTGDEVKAEQQAAWTSAQSNAVGAAMSYLKRPVKSHPAVTLVVSGGPSDGILKPGDLILEVGGKPVTEPRDVGLAIKGKKPGTVVKLQISRAKPDAKDEVKDRDQKSVSVTLGEDPHTPGGAWLGIGLDPYFRAPFDITFNLVDVGGPSAGLFFTLGIIDKLTPGAMVGDHHVAGTGTIAPDGAVGPIGGIAQKMVGARRGGAELFLAPGDNCDEVVGNIPDGLTVARVTTVDEAVDAIDAFRSGSRDLPSCR